jgi:integrase/recombinase XerD
MVSKPRQVLVRGPLAAQAAGFREELKGLHYTPLSAANQLRLLAHLSRWLESKELEPGELTPARTKDFLRARRREYTCWRSERGLAPLLAYLRRIGVVPSQALRPPSTAVDRLLVEYVEYLRRERGISEAGVRFREGVARELLAGRSAGMLTAEIVTRFMLGKTRRYSVGAAAGTATAVRSLLRFMHVRGHIGVPLVGAVPKIAGWRLTSLPRDVSDVVVDALLGSCDRRTSVGRRDFAILLLLVRLGLRAGEVAALRLEDVDWRRGEMEIRGKGGRMDRLPLPRDVGDALVAYLRRGRPTCEARTVFVSHRAPHGTLRSSAVTSRVGWAARDAGIPPFGAHRLRHTVATRMLRRGSSLADIAQVLRHRSVQTTAIYAKVDRDALRSLARPWPRVRPTDVDGDALRALAQPWPGAS